MKLLYISLFTLWSVWLHAQVGIGTTDPNENSLLELNNTTKGFLPPRVMLTSTEVPSPLDVHVEGMIVYNLATTNNVTPGLYINSGTAWQRMLAAALNINLLALNTASQSIPKNTPLTPITFNTYNISDSNYNNSTSTYTVPTDGYYEISFSSKISISANGTNAVKFFLTVGGTNVDIFTKEQNKPYTDNVFHSRIMFLTMGETIQPTIRVCDCHAAGASPYVISDARFSVELVKK